MNDEIDDNILIFLNDEDWPVTTENVAEHIGVS
jgi:hypothetical protein